MTAENNTPGVSVAEQGALGTITGVETSVPVFIGYTERAERAGRSMHLQPVRITSLADYGQSFGGRYAPAFRLTPSRLAPDTVVIGAASYRLAIQKRHDLYNGLRLFYANGGGACYVVSVGSYGDAMSAEAFQSGLLAVRDLAVTMLVIPEAIQLAADGYRSVVQAMLRQCLDKQDRVAMLDVPPASASNPDPIKFFRDVAGGVPSAARRYGIAYYPLLVTSLVDAGAVGYGDIAPSDLPQLQASLLAATVGGAGSAIDRDVVSRITQVRPGDPEYQKINQALAGIPSVATLYQSMAAAIGTLPPSAAIAAVYTVNDATRGVWKAPANMALSSVVAPSVKITDAQQQDLNAPLDGFAVNAIRGFVGRGVLVWGARTLDGNSSDWRYVNVSRTGIFIAQSIKGALAGFMFQPNNANTWVSVTAMIENFLTQLWRQGCLMGATPKDALNVACGLGVTMTAEDILQGNMNVTVQVALIRPAEFTVLAFQQKMNTG